MRARSWVLCAALVAVAQGCGPRTMAVRVRDAERLAGRIDDRLGEAQRAQQALEVDLAERALREAKRGLGEPDLLLYPESELLKERYAELEAALPAVRAAREKRDLERRLEAIRDSVVGHGHAIAEALPNLSAEAPEARTIDAVERPARAVLTRLDAEREHLAKDASFSAWAKSQRTRAEKALDEVAVARARLAIIQGPGAAYGEALEAQARAQALKKAAERVPELERATARAEACAADEAKRRVPPPLDTGALKLAGKRLTPTALYTACRALAAQARTALTGDRAQLAREAAAAKRAADAARALEERKARAAEAKRKQDEAKRKQDEAKRQQDEAKRKKAEAERERREARARAAAQKKPAEAKPPAKPPSKPGAKPAAKVGAKPAPTR